MSGHTLHVADKKPVSTPAKPSPASMRRGSNTYAPPAKSHAPHADHSAELAAAKASLADALGLRMCWVFFYIYIKSWDFLYIKKGI
jgi:hypothetical protein